MTYLQKKYSQCLILVVVTVFCEHVFANFSQTNQVITQKAFSDLETYAKGRLGVFAINTATNQKIAYHENDRFPLCSTSKVMGVAAMLKRSEKNNALLQKKITYKKSDLITWSPVTKKHRSMTIAALNKAAMTLSDNTAMDLLIKQLGGPKTITAFARTLGDNRFRLDRLEPALSAAIPGDLRDTSTPKAMATSLRQLVLDHALAPKQQTLLKTYLLENTTGNARIRAGTPTHWVVGDKTGTCGHYGATNDIGIVWPKDRAPIVIAVYFTGEQENAMPRDDVIANATRISLHAIKDRNYDKQ